MTNEQREQLKKLLQALNEAKEPAPSSSPAFDVLKLKADQLPPELLEMLKNGSAKKITLKKSDMDSTGDPLRDIIRAVEKAEQNKIGSPSEEKSEEEMAMDYAHQTFDELFNYDNVDTELALANLVMVYTMKEAAVAASAGINPMEILLKGPGIMSEIIDLSYLADTFHGKNVKATGPVSTGLENSLNLGKSIYGSLSSGRTLSVQDRIAAVSLALSLLLREAQANK